MLPPDLSIMFPAVEDMPTDADDFIYVPWDQVPGTALDKDYETKPEKNDPNNPNQITKPAENLDESPVMWSYHVEGAEGSASLAAPGMTQPYIGGDIEQRDQLGPNLLQDRKYMAWDFSSEVEGKNGTLEPGQTLVLDVMMPISSDANASISKNLLDVVGYAHKNGKFSPYIPEEQANDRYIGWIVDTRDANLDGDVNQLLLNIQLSALTFVTNNITSQAKTATTDLVTDYSASARGAAPTAEGSTYTYRAQILNLGAYSSGSNYTHAVAFDMLPFKGDEQIYNSDAGEAISRNSQWNGWLTSFDDIVMRRYDPQADDASGIGAQLTDNECTIWVGPFKKQSDGSIVAGTVDDLPREVYKLGKTQQGNAASEAGQWMTAHYYNKNGEMEKDGFVKLSEIKAYLANHPEAEEGLLKGVRAIWGQVADDIYPSGGGRIDMEYKLRTPLNLPKYTGDIAKSGNDASSQSVVSLFEGAADAVMGFFSLASQALGFAEVSSSNGAKNSDNADTLEVPEELANLSAEVGAPRPTSGDAPEVVNGSDPSGALNSSSEENNANDAIEDSNTNNKLLDSTVQWNTFLQSINQQMTDQSVQLNEGSRAGVFVDAPSGRGYIGDYVWHDADWSGTQNDTAVGESSWQESVNGRKLLRGIDPETGESFDNSDDFADLDLDGSPDDPGINGVKVELLNEEGQPVNRDGYVSQWIDNIGQDGKGMWVQMKPDGSGPLLDENQSYQLAEAGKAYSYTTESDYYGNAGYFILSNLATTNPYTGEPMKYKLRYTFPEQYRNYAVTTKELGPQAGSSDVVNVTTERVAADGSDSNGSTVLTAVTDAFTIQEVAFTKGAPEQATHDPAHATYDAAQVSFDMGIALPVSYSGAAYRDDLLATWTEGENEEEYQADPVNGLIDDQTDPATGTGLKEPEYRLPDMKISVREYDPETDTYGDTAALDADGNPAEMVTGKDGRYGFTLIPGKQYVVVAENTSSNTAVLLKPTPFRRDNNPTAGGGDNDLYTLNGKMVMRPFKASMPVDKSGAPQYVEGKRENGYIVSDTLYSGLVDGTKGFVGDLVFEDANRDGIQQQDENGIGGLGITLERWYWEPSEGDSGVWKPVIDSETGHVATERTITADSGVYAFKVRTFVAVDNEGHEVEEGGTQKLTGFKVRIDTANLLALDESFVPTHRNRGSDDGLDSDLIREQQDAYGDPGTKTRYLTDENECIIVAERNDNPTEAVDGPNGVTYDLASGMDVLEWDAGFVRVPRATIDGTVWDDSARDGVSEGYDGLRDTGSDDTAGEPGIAEQKLYLSQWVLNPKSDESGELEWQRNTAFGTTADKFGNPRVSEAAPGVETDPLPTSEADGYMSFTTDTSGHYEFNGLPVSYTDPATGQIYLASYQVSLEKLKDGYLPTRYHADDATDASIDTCAYDSDISEAGIDGRFIVHDRVARKAGDPSFGTRMDDRIVLAKAAKGDGLLDAVDSADRNKNYDGLATVTDEAGTARVTGGDAGEVLEETGDITGIIWNDEDKDGIREKDEKGVENISVTLDRFVPDGQGGWMQDATWQGATAATSQRVASETDTSDSPIEDSDIFARFGTADGAGVYSFTNLATHGVVNDKNVPYAYRVRLTDPNSVESTWLVTAPHVGRDTSIDSDLLTEQGKNGNLMDDGDYLVLLDETDMDTPAYNKVEGPAPTNNDDRVSITYDIAQVEDQSGQDGGLIEAPTTEISGVLFVDNGSDGRNGLYDASGTESTEGSSGSTGDTVLSGKQVILQRWALVDGQWKKSGNPITTTTGTDGRFIFGGSNAEATGVVPVSVWEDGARRLAGYTLSVDGSVSETGVGGMPVTAIQVDSPASDDRNSKALRPGSNQGNVDTYGSGTYPLAWGTDKDQLNGYKDGRLVNGMLVVAASKGEELADSMNIVENHNLAVARPETRMNGGFAEAVPGAIDGLVWDDANYNGVQDIDPSSPDSERGLDGVTVHLSQYFLDGSTWKRNDSFVYTAPAGSQALASSNGAVTTDNQGNYSFSNLPSYVRVVQGANGAQPATDGDAGDDFRLAAYRVTVDVPEGRAATRLHAAGDTEHDSDLVLSADQMSGDLHESYEEIQGKPGAPREDGFVVLAQKAGDMQPNTPYLATSNGVEYSVLDGAKTRGGDAGFIEPRRTQLSGRIWHDADKDGIQKHASDGSADVTEPGIAGVAVTLEHWYFKSDSSLQDGSWLPVPGENGAAQKTETCVTGENSVDGQDAGEYSFNVPTTAIVDGVEYLAGYKIRMDAAALTALDTAYGVTLRHAGDDSADSDLSREVAQADNAQDVSTRYLTDDVVIAAHESVLENGGEASQYEVAGPHGVAYDKVNGVVSDAWDGGLIPVPTSSIEGRVWNDADGDGLQKHSDDGNNFSEDEPGISGQGLTLQRWIYRPDVTSSEGQASTEDKWVLDPTFGENGIRTTQTLIEQEAQVQGREAGDYLFDNLPTAWMDPDTSELYLAAYTVSLDSLNTDESGKWLLTRYHAGTEESAISLDSDASEQQEGHYPLHDRATFVANDPNAGTRAGDRIILADVEQNKGIIDGLASLFTGAKDNPYTVVDGDVTHDLLAATDTQRGGDVGEYSAPTASISGQLWFDANHDGLISDGETSKWKDTNKQVFDDESAEESGMPSWAKEVKLQAWVRINEGGTTSWQPYNGLSEDELTTTTNEDGTYTFENLPTAVAFEQNGKTTYQLLGYTLAVNGESSHGAFDKNGVGGLPITTIEQNATDPDSDNVNSKANRPASMDGSMAGVFNQSDYPIIRTAIDTEGKPQSANMLDGRIVLAQDKASAGDNLQDAYEQDGYNMAFAQSEQHMNGGFIPPETGAIEGVVWSDTNYDGIQQTDEQSASAAQTDVEPGIEGREVVLTRYYLGDNDEWVVDPTGRFTTTTDADGKYLFDNLAPYVRLGNTDDYRLASYRVSVEAAHEGEIVTRLHAGDDPRVDSDAVVNAEGEPLELREQQEKSADGTLRDDGNVIIAHPVSDDGAAASEYQDTYKGVTYDVVRANDEVLSGGDAGFTNRRNAVISGRIWNDVNNDGIQATEADGSTYTADEAGIAGVTVTLECWVWEPSADGEGGQWNAYDVPEGFTDTTQTVVDKDQNLDGDFSFSVPTTLVQNGHEYLAGYRLRVDADALSSMPSMWGVTLQNEGSDDALDSDLDRSPVVATGTDNTMTRYLTQHDDVVETIIPTNKSVLAGDDASQYEVAGPLSSTDATGKVMYDKMNGFEEDTHDGGLVAVPHAAIEGRVWNDADSDGLQKHTQTGEDPVFAADEPGIAGQQVTLEQWVLKPNNDDSNNLEWQRNDKFGMPGDAFTEGKVTNATSNNNGGVSVNTCAKNDEYPGFNTLSSLQEDPGAYLFDNLPTAWMDPDTSELYLAAYTVRLDGLASGYNLSRYHVGETANDIAFDSDAKSHDPANGFALHERVEAGAEGTDDGTRAGDRIILAAQSDVSAGEKASGLTALFTDNSSKTSAGNDPYIKIDTATDNIYTLFNATETQCGGDVGESKIPSATITGVVWDDANFDGIQNERWNDANGDGIWQPEETVTTPEVNRDGVAVKLSRYVPDPTNSDGDGDAWKLDEAFEGVPEQDRIQYTSERLDSRNVSSHGVYRFEGLPISGVDENGNEFAYAYRVSLADPRNVKDSYLISASRQGDPEQDSDLFQDGLLGDASAQEYLVLMNQATVTTAEDNRITAPAAALNSETQVLDTVIYDKASPADKRFVDAGLLNDPLQSIGGTVWNDANYDGIMSDGEKVYEGKRVTLTTWVYDSEKEQWHQVPDAQQTQLTRADGSFLFDGLKVSEQNSAGVRQLLGYTVSIDGSNSDTGVGGMPVTLLQVNSPQSDALNSKVRRVSADPESDPTFVAPQAGDMAIAWTQTDEASANQSLMDGRIVLAAPAASESSSASDSTSVLNATNSFYEFGKDGYRFNAAQGHNELRMNAGFGPYPLGSLTGVVWDDQAYDGVRNFEGANEEGFTDSPLAGQPISLTQWYLSEDGTWEQNTSFGEAGQMHTTTNDKGVYTFSDLPSYVQLDTEGNPVPVSSGDPSEYRGADTFRLASYRVSLDEMPEGYAATRYHVGKDSEGITTDSDLLVDLAAYNSMQIIERYNDEGQTELRGDGYAIIATPNSFGRPTQYEQAYNNVTYDVLLPLSEAQRGGDAGMLKAQLASISGVAWIDEDKDGLHQDTEKPLAGVQVKLTRYIYDAGAQPRAQDGESLPEDSDVTTSRGSWKYDKSFNDARQSHILTTGDDGAWCFDNLPATGLEVREGALERVVYGYRVNVVDFPDYYEPTTLNAGQGDASALDIVSDLNAATTRLMPDYPVQGLIVLADSTQGSDPSYITRGPDGSTYSSVLCHDSTNNDAGFLPDGATRIEGRAWNDANENGIQDSNETLVEGIAIYLDQALLPESFLAPGCGIGKSDGAPGSDLDAFGEPLQATGSTIDFTNDISVEDFEWTPIASARTAYFGNYAFENLPVANADGIPYVYRVRAEVPDGTTLTKANVGNDDNADSDFTLQAGSDSMAQTETLEVALPYVSGVDAYGSAYDLAHPFSWEPNRYNALDLGLIYEEDVISRLFMPKTGDSLPFGWLVLIVVASGVVGLGAYKLHKRTAATKKK